jgi:hypothetical protein
MPAAAYTPTKRLPGQQVSPLAAAWRLFMLWESRRFAALACVAALGVCCTALMRFNEANAYLGQGRFLLLPMLAVLPILIPLFGSGPGLTDLSGRSYRALQLLPMSPTQRRQTLWLEHFLFTGLAAPVVAGLAVGILPVPWEFKLWFVITLLIWSVIVCFFNALSNYVSNGRDAWTWAVLLGAALFALAAYQWRDSEWPMLAVTQVSIVGMCWLVTRMPVRPEPLTGQVAATLTTPMFEARHTETRRLFVEPLVRHMLIFAALVAMLFVVTAGEIFGIWENEHFKYLYFGCNGASMVLPYAERSMRALPVSSWRWTAGFGFYALAPGVPFAVAVLLLAPTGFSWPLAVVVALISLLLFALTSLLFQTWTWFREQGGDRFVPLISFTVFGTVLQFTDKILPLPGTLFLLLGVAMLVVTLLLWIRYRTLWDSRRYARIKQEDAVQDAAHPDREYNEAYYYWVLAVFVLIVAFFTSLP